MCAFVRDNLKLTTIDLPAIFFNLEILCIDLILNNVKQCFICAYRPPGYNSNQTCEQIECLHFLCDVCCIVTICDDFNF